MSAALVVTRRSRTHTAWTLLAFLTLLALPDEYDAQRNDHFSAVLTGDNVALKALALSLLSGEHPSEERSHQLGLLRRTEKLAERVLRVLKDPDVNAQYQTLIDDILDNPEAHADDLVTSAIRSLVSLQTEELLETIPSDEQPSTGQYL